MELSETEAFGALDDHQGRIWDINANFNHGRADDDVELVIAELLEDVNPFLGR